MSWRHDGTLSGPRGLCCVEEDVYICDLGNNVIRATDSRYCEELRTVVGNGTKEGPIEGPVLEIALEKPRFIFPGLHGEFYITCSDTDALLEWRDGRISVKAGGPKGFSDGPARQARFTFPRGGCVDPSTGDIYLADFGNDRIRRITPDGMVSTLGMKMKEWRDGALDGATFLDPNNVTLCNGRLIVSQSYAIRHLDLALSQVTTLAGGNSSGFEDGPGTTARFSQIYSVAGYGESIFIADASGRKIRLYDENGMVSTLAFEMNGPPFGICFTPSGHLVIAHSGTNQLQILYNLVPGRTSFSLSELASFRPEDLTEVGLSIHPQLLQVAYPTLHQHKDFIDTFLKSSCLNYENLQHFLLTNHVPRDWSTSSIADLLVFVEKCLPNFTGLDEIRKSFSSKLITETELVPIMSRLQLFSTEQSITFKMLQEKRVVGSTDLGKQASNFSHAQARRTGASSKSHLQERLSELFLEKIALEPCESCDRDDANANPDPNFTLESCDGESIACHDWVLYARWHYFRCLVSAGETEEMKTRRLVFPPGSLTYKPLKAFVRYLYTGNDMEFISGDNPLELLRNARQFNVLDMETPAKPYPGFEDLIATCRHALSKEMLMNDLDDIKELAQDIGTSIQISRAKMNRS